MPMRRTAKAGFYVEGVLPVAVSQNAAYYAGEVDFLSAGCFVQYLVLWHRLFVQPLIGGVRQLCTMFCYREV